MKQIINSIKKSKQLLFDKFAISQENTETTIENQDKFIKFNLVREASSLNTPDEFDNSKFIKELELFLKEKLLLKFEISELDSIKIYKYHETKGLKNTLGISGTFYLFLHFEKNLLLYDIKPESWLENWNKKSSKISISKLIQDSYENKIADFICEYIQNTYFADDKTFYISENSKYIENLNFKEKLWFLCEKSTNEILLAFLGLADLKNVITPHQGYSKLKWFYILTNENSFLTGFNDKSDITEQIEITRLPMSVKNEIGRDPVKVGDLQWLELRTHKNQYHEITDFVGTEKNARVYEFARLNKIYNEKQSNYSKFLLQELKKLRNDSFDDFSILYLDIAENKEETKTSVISASESVIELIKKILKEENVENKLIEWTQKWNISTLDSYTIIQLFLQISTENSEFKKFISFHKKIKEIIHKNEKDKINIIIFDIDFCKHLINCGENKEAIKIIENCLKSLPDETLSDLLPPANLDLTSKASGQILRVKLLELLEQAKDKKESNAILQQIAYLQPLSKERLDKLIEISSSDLQTRTKELRNLLETEKLQTASIEYKETKYNSLTDKTIEEKLKHPSTRKGEVFSSVQSWIASVKIPDYSVIKSYSEPLTSRNHPEINNIVTDIKVAMNLTGVEVYIARGDKSVGITSFEGTVPFLIIGGNHLDKEAPHYLTLNELKFAIGVELAHLYFKHSRITSTDVWRGAIEKGSWVFDTVISILPVAGILGKSLTYVGKLNSLAQLLEKTEKISKVTSKSQEVISTTNQVVSIYKTKTNKEEKEKELLAISRLLQLTADRAGILFCGDMKSAIRAIFLTSAKYAADLSIAERYGLTEFLLKQDDNKNYIHQELAIRFASLFAFYISDDYTFLKEKLQKK